MHNTQVSDKHRADYISYEQNKEAQILPRSTIDWFMGMCGAA